MMSDFPKHRIDLAVSILNATDNRRGFSVQESELLRLFKLVEEIGEVAEAVIGYTGQNPRKGFSHTLSDITAELADVILTAMVAMASINPCWYEVLTAAVVAKTKRLLTPGAYDDDSTEKLATEGSQQGMCADSPAMGRDDNGDSGGHSDRESDSVRYPRWPAYVMYYRNLAGEGRITLQRFLSDDLALAYARSTLQSHPRGSSVATYRLYASEISTGDLFEYIRDAAGDKLRLLEMVTR